MENRILNVTFGKSGVGSISPKLSLPVTNLKNMKIVPENRKINYYYDNINNLIFLSKEKIKNIKIEVEYEN